MHHRARWGHMPLLCAYRGMLRRYLPQNTRKRLRRHGKRLGKRRLLDIQPPYVRQLMEHGRLPAGCQKVSFSLLLSVSRECGLPWCFTSECLSMRGQSPKPFKTSTTECSETPSATRKAAGEKTSSRYPAAICSPTNGTWTLASGMPEGVFRCCHLCPANEGFCSW